MSLIASLSRPSQIYDLSVPMQNGMAASPSHVPFSMALLRRHGDRNRDGSGGSAAVAMIVTGDHVGTHIDALCHVASQGVMCGGIVASEAMADGRFVKLGAETIEPMICRGVLFDIPKLKGVGRLEAGYGVTEKDLEEALDGAELRKGDVALVRTGWRQLYEEPEKYLGEKTGVPGVTEGGARWLAASGVRAAGADTVAFDQIELGPKFNKRPCHGVLLWQNGIHIIEVLDLEGLAKDNVKEFLFILSPLKIMGATGSPVRPLAVVEV